LFFAFLRMLYLPEGKEIIMYRSPVAERLIPESDEEIMNLDFLLASTEPEEETDNSVNIDDLLGGLM